MSSRFIDLGTVAPEYSSAADAAVFEEVSGGRSPPTLHICSRDRTTVSLGRFRNLGDDVELDAFERLGLCAVRRISGGSTILTGPSQIIYSVTVPDLFEDKKDSYRQICGCVASALVSLGIDAVYKEPNDILSGGMKISGGAQYRARGFILQHGTIIMEPEPLIDEVLVPIKERAYPGTVSVSEMLGHPVSREDMAVSLRSSFDDRLRLDLKDGGLTHEEKKFIAENSLSFIV